MWKTILVSLKVGGSWLENNNKNKGDLLSLVLKWNRCLRTYGDGIGA
jgi:hypothetical protein